MTVVVAMALVTSAVMAMVATSVAVIIFLEVAAT